MDKELAKFGYKVTRHPACTGYTVDTPNGTEYKCAYETNITCDECKYGAGRKDPTARRNLAK